MRLISLQLTAQGAHGWESPVLNFGHRTTSLYAKNGSGKTPLVHALAFCLGYPVTFRNDINDKCKSALLTIEHNGQRIILERFIGKEFSARLTFADGQSVDYFYDADYSNAIFELVGMGVPTLVSTSKQATQPYLATVLPIFYLNQDTGYSDAYRPYRPFISDQFVEMIRFVFGLAPKHSFEEQKDLLAAKESLDQINNRIVEQYRRVTDRAADIDETQDNIETLDRTIATLKEQQSRLQDSVTSKSAAHSALQELLGAKDDAISTAKRSMMQLRDRLRGIETIRSEIDAEMLTLGLNEDAKRVFESFSEICNNPGCSLFIGSSQSYAKNLLYLKDQLKDLERNEEIAKSRVAFLEGDLRQLEAERNEIASQIAPQGSGRDNDEILAAIRQVHTHLYNAGQKKSAINILANERTTYFRLEAERDHIHDRIATLSKARHADLEFNRLRLELRGLIVKWLDILETKNVKKDIDIDLDFRVTFGGERIEQIPGSTKIRVVLAIHAAILEAYLKNPDRPFRFLILDTPKQQEIQTQDLAGFLVEISKLLGQLKAQLVFSTTEYRFPSKEQDAEWLPTFEGPEQPMYLHPARPMT
jgi:predicted  nucleic acid-binding Zn-ribbon protein